MKNLFAELPACLDEELVDVLAESEHVRIERIVSTGQSSPPGFWYDQVEHEWIVVLRGGAVLQFESDEQPVRLEQGDCLNIPAGRRHRVESTSTDQPTVWLAVFYR